MANFEPSQENLGMSFLKFSPKLHQQKKISTASTDSLVCQQLDGTLSTIHERSRKNQFKHFLRTSRHQIVIATAVLVLVVVIVCAVLLMSMNTREVPRCHAIEPTPDTISQNRSPQCYPYPILLPYEESLKSSFGKLRKEIMSLSRDEFQYLSLKSASINAAYDGEELFSIEIGNGSVNYSSAGDQPMARGLYPIASITKILTAMLLYKLHQNGSIPDVDQDIRSSKFFPELSLRSRFGDGEPITLREMTCQMSGITREAPCFPPSSTSYCPYTTQEMLARLNNSLLFGRPGSVPSYSNLAFALLGRAIEKHENESFENLLRKHILNPLGMIDTSYVPYVNRTERRNYLLKSLTEKRAPIADWGWLRPAAGLYSTTADLTKLANVFLNKLPNNILKPSERQQILDGVYDFPGGGAQGCPFEIHTFPRSNRAAYRMYTKQGSIFGYNSLFILIPSLKLNLNILSEGGDLSSQHLAMKKTLPHILDGLESWLQRVSKTKYILPKDPGNYTGTYRTTSDWPLITRPVNISLENGVLFLTMEWLKAPLVEAEDLTGVLRTGDYGYIARQYPCQILTSGLIGMELRFERGRNETSKMNAFSINGIAAYGYLRFEALKTNSSRLRSMDV